MIQTIMIGKGMDYDGTDCDAFVQCYPTSLRVDVEESGHGHEEVEVKWRREVRKDLSVWVPSARLNSTRLQSGWIRVSKNPLIVFT